MATGLLSEGITLSYKKATVLTTLPDLQEIPELGGTKEKVEVTTLNDTSKRYINGIKDYGDLAFKFLYDNSAATSSYRVLAGLETSNALTEFEVAFPDGTKFAFSGYVAVKVGSAAVNAPLTFTATITLNTAITVTNPAAG